jgi:hypothetical protein
MTGRMKIRFMNLPIALPIPLFIKSNKVKNGRCTNRNRATSLSKSFDDNLAMAKIEKYHKSWRIIAHSISSLGLCRFLRRSAMMMPFVSSQACYFGTSGRIDSIKEYEKFEIGRTPDTRPVIFATFWRHTQNIPKIFFRLEKIELRRNQKERERERESIECIIESNPNCYLSKANVTLHLIFWRKRSIFLQQMNIMMKGNSEFLWIAFITFQILLIHIFLLVNMNMELHRQ